MCRAQQYFPNAQQYFPNLHQYFLVHQYFCRFTEIFVDSPIFLLASPIFLSASLCVSKCEPYIHTYIHTYILTYIHTYIHTYIPTLFCHASLISHYLTGFLMRGVNENKLTNLQDRNNTDNTLHIKKDILIQIYLKTKTFTSKFQLILCFKIDLKDLKDSAILASLGRLFQCRTPL